MTGTNDISEFLFTSESVNEGHPGTYRRPATPLAPLRHGRTLPSQSCATCVAAAAAFTAPLLARIVSHHSLRLQPRTDKLCDQVSDAILDACLKQDPQSKVACETCTKTGMVMVFGESRFDANVLVTFLRLL
jgi:hypothetical protein